MTGEGHSDWVSGCRFNPTGDLLCTTSGDGSAKLWNTMEQTCVLTVTDHCEPGIQ